MGRTWYVTAWIGFTEVLTHHMDHMIHYHVMHNGVLHSFLVSCYVRMHVCTYLRVHSVHVTKLGQPMKSTVLFSLLLRAHTRTYVRVHSVHATQASQEIEWFKFCTTPCCHIRVQGTRIRILVAVYWTFADILYPHLCLYRYDGELCGCTTTKNLKTETYRRLWLLSTCAYSCKRQGNMRIIDNVRL